MAGLLSWLERHPIHQEVAGSIPGWGPYKKSTNQRFSLSPFPLFKITKHILRWGYKKKKREEGPAPDRPGYQWGKTSDQSLEATVNSVSHS